MYALFTILAVAAVAVAADNQTALEEEELKVENIITNGYPAYEGKAPYIVGLKMGKNNNNGRWVGAGTIIAHNWVLTARHCIAEADFAEVHYGSNRAWNGQYNHKVYKPNLILHENSRFDIGLIRTPHVDFHSRVNKVNLPKFSQRNERFVNWWAVACGWGGMANGQLADWLQCIDVQIISNDECRRTFGSGLLDEILCTRTTGGTSPCGGDSGGPLVTHDSPVLVGITPFGAAGPCTGGHPAGFTRVTSHIEWIRDKSGVAYY
ncbi:serine protease 1-like isoform X2 [Drosophila albomicans]|uniref:Serine protease 1-like isoform X2 n=1 Tax=Drosophila albomicans TaxID=7291 RepID=A0A9C6WED3_DROAB|nr:serine protease 1-like isoform X2 [Drosophila albomicans]